MDLYNAIKSGDIPKFLSLLQEYASNDKIDNNGSIYVQRNVIDSLFTLIPKAVVTRYREQAIDGDYYKQSRYAQKEWAFNVLSMGFLFPRGKREAIVRHLICNGWIKVNERTSIALKSEYCLNGHDNLIMHPLLEAIIQLDEAVLEQLIQAGAHPDRITMVSEIKANRLHGHTFTHPLLKLDRTWFEPGNENKLNILMNAFAMAGVDFNPRKCKRWESFKCWHPIKDGISLLSMVGYLTNKEAVLLWVRQLVHHGHTSFVYYRRYYRHLTAFPTRLEKIIPKSAENNESETLIHQMCQLGMRHRPSVEYVEVGHSPILDYYYTQPMTLEQQCRLAIRRAIGGVHFVAGVKTLPLPNALKDYVIAI